MRTTLNIDDDVLLEAKRYAKARSLTLGKAVSELMCKGLKQPLRTHMVNGFCVVDVPPDSPPVTSELVKRLADEID
jgi:hypothetical protein